MTEVEVEVALDSKENTECEVRQLLVLSSEADVKIYDNAHDQLQYFAHFFTMKMDHFKKFLESNSVVVFTVNYIQNRFIAAEFCAEIVKIFEILNVKTVAEFEKGIEALRMEPTTAGEVEHFESVVKGWDEFIGGIEKTLEEKVGPSTAKADKDLEALPELGIENRTISQYVKGSAYDMVLVVVVRSFTSSSVTQHIMDLYNKIPEFRKLGCDVCLLTRGPPVGVRGGSYIKLIGVPFRKLYDDDEALAELRCHRRSALELVGWNALLQLVEASFVNEMRPNSTTRKTSSCPIDDHDCFITQKGGTILVDQSGTLLFKYIEEENATWPKVDEILAQVKKVASSNPRKASNKSKVDSEISSKEKKSDKQCCVML